MATRVFFLNKLKDGVDPAEYERWLVERDYPYARSLASIKRYEVTPNGGGLDGFGADLPFDYRASGLRRLLCRVVIVRRSVTVGGRLR